MYANNAIGNPLLTGYSQGPLKHPYLYRHVTQEWQFIRLVFELKESLGNGEKYSFHCPLSSVLSSVFLFLPKTLDISVVAVDNVCIKESMATIAFLLPPPAVSGGTPALPVRSTAESLLSCLDRKEAKLPSTSGFFEQRT
jgi:hypothetical protein